MEVWKPIPGWENLYQASSLGRIRSLPRLSRVNSVSSGLRTMGGTILKPGHNIHGYQTVQLSVHGKAITRQVHKLVLSAFAPMPTPKSVCRHKNGIRTNNGIENLLWGTHGDNMADRDLHCNTAKGERHGMAKLTAEQALFIYYSDELGTVLASRFGINKTKVSAIRRGLTWKHVTGGIPRPCRKVNQYGSHH